MDTSKLFFFQMPDLETAVLSACEQKNEIIQSIPISFVYDRTAPRPPLRQFVIDMCAKTTSSVQFATLKNELPVECCRDLCEFLITRAEATILQNPVSSIGNSEVPKPVVRLPGQKKRKRSDSPGASRVKRM